MASADQIAELRRKISEPDETTWSDTELETLIDAANGDINVVASSLWEDKASEYAELTDITEAGSTRKNSTLYKAALEMAQYYRTAGANGGDTASSSPTTRKIVRQ